MGVDFFTGRGVGLGFGIGCGFGIGWGFGGAPLNTLGIGVGGGCGIGLGLGWGFGAAYGTKYLDSKLRFEGIDFDKAKGGTSGSEKKDLESEDLQSFPEFEVTGLKKAMNYSLWKMMHPADGKQ